MELFFEWSEQQLRITRFYGTPVNAVGTQIRIAISTYVPVAIARKRLGVERDLHTLLQVMSVYEAEKAPPAQALAAQGHTTKDTDIHSRLSLFDLWQDTAVGDREGSPR